MFLFELAPDLPAGMVADHRSSAKYGLLTQQQVMWRSSQVSNQRENLKIFFLWRNEKSSAQYKALPAIELGSQLLLLHVQIDALLVAFSCGKLVHPALILNLWRVDCQVRMGEGREKKPANHCKTRGGGKLNHWQRVTVKHRRFLKHLKYTIWTSSWLVFISKLLCLCVQTICLVDSRQKWQKLCLPKFAFVWRLWN